MADVEVLVLGVGAVGHGTANLVGSVPDKLRREAKAFTILNNVFFLKKKKTIASTGDVQKPTEHDLTWV